MRQLLIYTIILASILLSGCELFSVHKIDVQQGNAVEAGDVDKVRIGMSREQVTFLLGSPMLTDAFHADRWDYLYYLNPGRGETESRRLTLHFEADRVVRIETADLD